MKTQARFHWPYYTLRTEDGRLVDEEAFVLLEHDGAPIPVFKSIIQAEDWLRDNDLRGNVRDEAESGPADLADLAERQLSCDR